MKYLDRDKVEVSTCGASYNNSGLMKRELTTEPIGTSTNDAGEKLQSTEETLKERGSRYGEFKTHAEISQQLKNIMFHGSDWDGMQEYQRESIEMICHKLARIANGDPFYDDNWRDIAGYAELVVKELNNGS